jgi:hypothetical protein
MSNREGACAECNAALGRSAWICLVETKGALCLSCADLDHLEFLPTGDAALTSRAKRGSGLWAVVLKWSASRKRYERQGLLVEFSALDAAEAACTDDASARADRARRRAAREEVSDREYVERFACEVRRRYPGCPVGRERAIAEHACRKYSQRIGRSAAAKNFDDDAIELAVRAHVRHSETEYDSLLIRGIDRHDARAAIAGIVNEVVQHWKRP